MRGILRAWEFTQENHSNAQKHVAILCDFFRQGARVGTSQDHFKFVHKSLELNSDKVHSTKIEKSSQLEKHGFGSLHNPTWT